MGKRKWMGRCIAVLGALLAGPALSAAQEPVPPVRINESFVMGDTGCQMNIVLDGVTGGLVSAELGPAFEPPAPPPPMQYSFDFTGEVHNATGDPPSGITVGTTYSGTLTYAPSTFALGDTTSDSQDYLPATDGSTIATLSVTFFNADSQAIQSFQTSTFGSSSVVNNRPDCCSDNVLDMYGFYSEFMSSDPSGSAGARSILFLRDEDPTNPDALSGLAYPTILNLADWSSPSSRLTVYALDSWQVDGRLTSLAPSVVPIPPGGIIINSLASPTVQQSAAVPEWCVGSPPIESITATSVCKDCSDNGDGTFDCTQATCEIKTAVEQNIMEKSGDGSTYCYYDKLGRRVCRTI